MIGLWADSVARRVVLTFLVGAIAAGSSAVHAGEYQDDLKARRARLMQSLDAGTVLIA